MRALMHRDAFPHDISSLTLLETHISWVLLTGEYAYKFKKPLDLGFLDFSTLEKRRLACIDEVRLNRRLAPTLYLDVWAVSKDGPALCPIHECNAPVEYAVRMRQFSPEDEVHRLLASGNLSVDELELFAVSLAQFHERLKPAMPDDGYATPEKIWRPVAENIRKVQPVSEEREAALAEVESWSRITFEKNRDIFGERLAAGRVRECHGDLHTRNLVRLGGLIHAFDCIEFNADLRWIDVINDIAFLAMDLLFEHRADLAFRFLSAWFERSGDYAGVTVLRFYLVYRAMVRAKIAAITQRQHPEDAEADEDVARHLALAQAQAISGPGAPKLVICCGLSGSGKSRISRQLIGALPAIRIRSDAERKRIFGLGPAESSASKPGAGIYTPGATQKVYSHVADCAQYVLEAGFSAIVDAANLAREQRELFYALAREIGVPCVLLLTEAPVHELEARITRRAAKPGEVSEAGLEVLRRQLETAELPVGEERDAALVVRTDQDVDLAAISKRIAEA